MDKQKNIKLCKNTDCLQYPPDWNYGRNTDDNYPYGQWQKCKICDGYFNDDGFGDLLFIEEPPNNFNHDCEICGKKTNIVQMKSSGQYICASACDESDEDSDYENK